MPIKQTFDVTGMTCAACSSRVEKTTNRVEGVRKANVNLLKNSMEVEFEQDANVFLVTQAIEAAVEKAGYGAIRAILIEEVCYPAAVRARGESASRIIEF